MSAQQPIRVLLSAPGQQALNAVYGQFILDKRLLVTGLATSPQMLEQALLQEPEVAVIDVELLAEYGESGILNFLASKLGNSVAIVLLPQPLGRLSGAISQLDRVREVLVKPVGVAQVIDRCYQVGISERAAREAMAPATVHAASALSRTTGAARVAFAGTRVFAIGGGKGGSGKTTVAVNLAYRLSQVGIRTLLMGFDIPDAVGIQLGLPMSPNSLNWFRRPTREGFAASLQHKDGLLDVCLSPNDKIEAARIAQKAPDQEGSIAHLVEAARDHHPPYAAIVMDLPPTESEWSIQPLLRANTVILVCEPDLASAVNLVSTIRLLTGVFDPRYRVPRDAIYAVLNRVEKEDVMTPRRMQEAVREQLDGWAPPFIAIIPADPGVRACQIDFIPPVTRRQEFTAGVDQIVDFFYGDVLGKPAAKAAGERSRGFLGIKIRVS